MPLFVQALFHSISLLREEVKRWAIFIIVTTIWKHTYRPPLTELVGYTESTRVVNNYDSIFYRLIPMSDKIGQLIQDVF